MTKVGKLIKKTADGRIISTNTEAAKARWAKIPKEERTRRMSKLGKLCQAKRSPRTKRRLALKMVEARKLIANLKRI